MLEAVNQFIGVFSKLAPAPLMALGVATAIILFVPDNYAATLGITEFREENRGLIGAGFILSWSSLAAYLVWEIKSYIHNILKNRKAKKARIDLLHNLTPDEKQYLTPYVVGHENTRHFEPEDGVIGGLARKGIVYQGSYVFDILEGVGWNIQSWAREYLVEHPELLKSSKN